MSSPKNDKATEGLKHLSATLSQRTSRRDFLGRLGKFGLGFGLGLVSIATTHAGANGCGRCGDGGCIKHLCNYTNGMCYEHHQCFDACGNYCDKYVNHPCSGC